MTRKDLNRVLNSGKSFWTTTQVQFFITAIAFICDSVLFYSALKTTLNESVVLNLIITLSGVLILDVTPIVIANVLHAEMKAGVKRTTLTILIVVMYFAFMGLFLVRWTTRESLGTVSLGLFPGEDVTTNQGLDVLAVFLGILPLLTSIVIFVMAMTAYDPDIREKKLIQAYFQSIERASELKRVISNYSTSENRAAIMAEYVNQMEELSHKRLDARETNVTELYKKTLTEHLHAIGHDITDIMEL